MRASDALVLSTVVLSTALLTGCGSASGNGDGTGAGPGDGGAGGTTNDDSGGSPPSGPLGPDAAASAADGGGGNGDDAAGGGDAASDDAATSSDAGAFVPASHPPFPLLVSAGGAVLTKPVVQPVFFKDYDLTAKVTQMVEGLPTATLESGDPFWSAAVGEYGVGALSVLPAIQLTDVAPTTDTDPAAFLSGKMTDPLFKNVTSSTVIALFYPSTTPLGGSCAAQTPGYGGYHDAFTNGSIQQPYAVMSECANFGPIKSALDMVTIAGSHEIIEAVTDPYPSGNSAAYVQLDNSGAGVGMEVFLGGNAENGDMCTINAGFGRGPTTYPFLLQRGWSNKAAKAGNVDPCSPDSRPSQPFVGAYPVLPDTVTVPGPNGQATGPGVVIPAGTSKVLEVDLFSFEPTADFTVGARQGSTVVPPTLTFAWNKTTGHNGDKLQLTVTSVTASLNGFETFIVYADLTGTADTQKPAWAAIVTHQ